MAMTGNVRALIVHSSSTAVAEIRDVLSHLVKADAVGAEAEAVRRLAEAEYAFVIIDRRAVGAPEALVNEIGAAQPDAFIVFMTTDAQEGRELDQAMPGRVFRFLAGAEQRWQLTGIVSEGLRLQRLEREQKELIK